MKKHILKSFNTDKAEMILLCQKNCMWPYIFDNPVHSFICKVGWKIQVTDNQICRVNLQLTAKQLTRPQSYLFLLIFSNTLGNFPELLFHLLLSILIAICAIVLSYTECIFSILWCYGAQRTRNFLRFHKCREKLYLIAS